MNGDGFLEVAVTTRSGQLLVYGTSGPADGDIQWLSQRHDPKNTGNYSTALLRQQGPTSLEGKEPFHPGLVENENWDSDKPIGESGVMQATI